MLRQKISTQRKGDPTVCVPALRFTSLRANLRHAIQSAVRQNSLRSKLLRSNSCRKSEHEATLSFGSIARSLNSVPQAHPHGWERDRRPARLVMELASSAYPGCASSYQNRKNLSGCPHPALPLVTTPVTASSWGWQLHRRVQLLRHQICGNCLNEAPEARSEFCRTASRA